LTTQPLGIGKTRSRSISKIFGRRRKEISETIRKNVTAASFRARYGNVFDGDANWKKVKVKKGQTYQWDIGSTYVKNPPYFDGMKIELVPLTDIAGARILALFGDFHHHRSHLAGRFDQTDEPAGIYLQEHQIRPQDFNSYGSRRGNHEVMRARHLRQHPYQERDAGRQGGRQQRSTYPSGEEIPIFYAAERYKAEGVPAVVIGGKEYGTGSSRDWAAKGPKLLGVRAVIVESFERIHRSNWSEWAWRRWSSKRVRRVRTTR